MIMLNIDEHVEATIRQKFRKAGAAAVEMHKADPSDKDYVGESPADLFLQYRSILLHAGPTLVTLARLLMGLSNLQALFANSSVDEGADLALQAIKSMQFEDRQALFVAIRSAQKLGMKLQSFTQSLAEGLSLLSQLDEVSTSETEFPVSSISEAIADECRKE
jgi:hypothetical protein